MTSSLLPVIPVPLSHTRKSGKFTIPPVLKISCAPKLSAACFLDLMTHCPIRQIESTSVSSAHIHVQHMKELQPAAYTLSIDSKKVVLQASDQEGCRNGYASLFQLLFHSRNTLPAVYITDQPQFAWRGCMLDCARHFFPPRFIRKWIRMMALLKMNILHWHFCDDQAWRIDLPHHPRLREQSTWRQEAAGAYGGYYSPDEVKDLVTYAQKYAITIVPELEMPGHAAAVLAAYPHLASAKRYENVPTTWGIFEDGYNIADQRVRDFLKSLIDELLPLFPSPYFHIGGDETPDEVWTPYAKPWKTVQALKKDFYTDIATHLQRQGKQTIGWDEAAESDIPHLLWTMVWRDPDYISPLLDKGYTLILSPQNKGMYLDWRQADLPHEPGRSWGISTLQTVFSQSLPASPQIRGMQAAIWTEGMRSEWEVEYMTFPRLLVLAQRFWNPTHGLHWPQMHSLIHQYIRLLDAHEIYYRPLEKN